MFSLSHGRDMTKKNLFSLPSSKKSYHLSFSISNYDFYDVCHFQTLLSEGVDVNTLDYKGATPLHRAKDAATVEVCAINTCWSSLSSKSVSLSEA